MPPSAATLRRAERHARRHAARMRNRIRASIAWPILTLGLLLVHTAFALPGCHDFGAPSEPLPTTTLIVGLTTMFVALAFLIWTQCHFHAGLRALTIVLCVYLLGFVSGLIWFTKLALHDTLGAEGWWIPGTLVVLAVLVCASGAYWRARRFTRATASGRLACIHCHYDMTSTPHVPRCPECGQPFDPAAVERPSNR